MNVDIRETQMNTILNKSFESLIVIRFRYMWLGDFALLCAEFMELLILSWYVLNQTNSPMILGVYAALRFTGTLFSPLFGVIVDRLGKRNIYIFSRICFVILSTIVMVLYITNTISVTYVLIISPFVGLSRSLDMIVRQSVIPSIVGNRLLQNSIALLRTSRDITQIVGPIMGGVLLELLGASFSYLVIVCLYVLALVFVLMIRDIPNDFSNSKESLILNFKQGISYALLHPFLVGILVIAFMVNLTGFPLNNGLMPVIAKDIMKTDAVGLGWMLGMYSAGALCGSLVMGYFSNMKWVGILMVLGALLWHVGIFFIGFVSTLLVAIPLLYLIGIFQSFAMVTMAMLLMSYTSKEMLGRILGLRQLSVYGLPLGLLFSGSIADNFDVTWALYLNGVIGFVILVIAVVIWPSTFKSDLSYQKN